MKLIEGCDYVKIKPNNVVVLDGNLANWTPEDSRSKHNGILRGMNDKYVKMLFKVVTKKPYPNRRRILLTGIFWEGSMYAGFRELEAWKEDLIFYHYMDGVLVPQVAPKPKKIKAKTESPLICLESDILSEIEDTNIDIMRDTAIEY